jgi:D-alanyl-D-alanine carboxypeptidase
MPSSSPTASLAPSYKPGLYSIDAADSIWVVVDKKRPLKPANYVPKSLVAPRFEDGAGINPNRLQLAKVAAKAIKLMASAMKAAGAGTLALASTYRSYNTQVAVHNKDVAALGLVAGENLAARPGYSEHQTGLAADLAAVGQGCSIQVCFATTKAGKWLAANSWQYGWILRYPNGRTATTGYQFEPWHFRYVGIELSTEMHRTGIAVLEDFFKLPAAPTY